MPDTGLNGGTKTRHNKTQRWWLFTNTSENIWVLFAYNFCHVHTHKLKDEYYWSMTKCISEMHSFRENYTDKHPKNASQTGQLCWYGGISSHWWDEITQGHHNQICTVITGCDPNTQIIYFVNFWTQLSH